MGFRTGVQFPSSPWRKSKDNGIVSWRGAVIFMQTRCGFGNCAGFIENFLKMDILKCIINFIIFFSTKAKDV